MNIKLAVLQLSSITQEARLERFRLLVQASSEGMPAWRIGENLQIPASTFSFHLKVESCWLINSRQANRFIYYSANHEAMNGLLLAYLTENCYGGAEVCGPESTCRTELGPI